MTMAVSVHILKVDNNMMNQISEGFPKFGCFIFPKKLSNISLHHYVKTIFNYSWTQCVCNSNQPNVNVHIGI